MQATGRRNYKYEIRSEETDVSFIFFEAVL